LFLTQHLHFLDLLEAIRIPLPLIFFRQEHPSCPESGCLFSYQLIVVISFDPIRGARQAPLPLCKPVGELLASTRLAIIRVVFENIQFKAALNSYILNPA